MEKFSDHKFGEVPAAYQQQGIRWIRLVPYEKSGVGLELYHDLAAPFLFDDWCENMELALRRAEKFYGVGVADWKSAEEVKKLGIEIIE
jgi:hypothetical protein